MTIFARNCIRGEVKQRSNICHKCPEGYYSLKIKNIICKKCPKNAHCPGGDLILADIHYWQSSNHSDWIHYCDEYKEFCLGSGNSTFKFNPCTKGHFGPLCKSCDIYGHDYN